MTAVVMPERTSPAVPRRRLARMGQGVALCLQMLRSALVTSHAALIGSVGVGILMHGLLGAVNAAVAGAVVVAFFASGQGVQLVASQMANGRGMALVLVSYGVRVGMLGVLLWAGLTHAGRLDQVLVRPAFFLGACMTLCGWLAGTLWTSTHQRVYVFDHEYDAVSSDFHDSREAEL